MKGYQKRIYRAFLYVLIATIVFMVSFPLLAMFLGSVKPDGEIITATPAFFPHQLTLDHYTFAFRSMPLDSFFRNSIIVATLVMAFSLAVSAYAAYILTRFAARGIGFITKVLVLFYMVPDIALVIGFYLVLDRIGLLNSYAGLVLGQSAISVPFCVWLLWGYFKGIPIDLDEAAMVDGASRIQTLARIILPIAIPALFSTGVFSFVLSWNEYTLASTLMIAEDLKTLPVGIALLTREGAYWGEIIAISSVATIPAFIVIAFAMRYLVEGLSAGAVKG